MGRSKSRDEAPVDSGRKVGDEPREATYTPSGADPATLENLNPPASLDDDGTGAPLLNRVVTDGTAVASRTGGADKGPVADMEGVRPGAYDIFARSGAQQPGGGSHMEPSNKANADVKGVEKIQAMMSHMPSDSPDDHVIYGYAGYKITIGDLRAIAGIEAPPASEQADDDEEA